MDMQAWTFSFCFLLLTVSAIEVFPDLDDYCEDWDENVSLEQLLEEFGDECPVDDEESLQHPDTCLDIYGFDLPKPVNVTFTSQPQNRSVSEERVILECVTEPRAVFTYWYFNGQRITRDASNPFSSGLSIMEGDVDQETMLIISTAGPGYYGEYRCEVVTPNGIAQTSAWISAPQEKACTLDFAVAPENIMVKRHGHATLHCSAKNIHGQSTIWWYKETSSGGWRRHRQQEGVETIPGGLHFIKVREEHKGRYMCKIMDNSGCSINSTAIVTVYRHIWEVCGTTPLIASQSQSNDEERAKYGSVAKKGSVPWQVSIQHNKDGHICGGVVLDQHWVITAAHCFVPSQGSIRAQLNQHNTLLKFGKHAILDINRQGTRFSPYEEHEQIGHVHKRIVHPNYRKGKLDVALVKLRSPMQFNDHVRPICLPLGEPELENSHTGKVTGWGSTQHSTGLSHKLQEIFVDIHEPADDCFNDQDTRDSMFCAGEGNKQGQSAEACKGDDGAPFAVPVNKDGHDKWYLTGVLSSGPNCLGISNSNARGIYTNVTTVLGWILQEMSNPKK